jgi:hypothetical protein
LTRGLILDSKCYVSDESDESQEREQLLNEIVTRMKRDRFFGRVTFNAAQLQGWLTVVASFGSAIAAAAGARGLVVAVAAAIPGTVILIDRNFGFARRAQWHWSSQGKLRELEHALKFQGAKVADISKKYTALRIEMDEKFPFTPTNLPHPQKDEPNPTVTSLVAEPHSRLKSSNRGPNLSNSEAQRSDAPE